MGPKGRRKVKVKEEENLEELPPFESLRDVLCTHSFSNVCKMKAKEYIQVKDYESAARCLSQVHAVYLYQRLCEKKLKMAQRSTENWTPLLEDQVQESSVEEISQKLESTSLNARPEFPLLKENYVQSVQGSLPEDWSVIQLTSDPHVLTNGRKVVVPGLYITLIKKTSGPFVTYVKPSNDDSTVSPMEEFASIIYSNESLHKNSRLLSSRKDYWEFREQLDLRMKSLLMTVQDKWIGAWKFLLSPPVRGSDVLRAKVKSTLQKLKLDPISVELLCQLGESGAHFTDSETEASVSVITAVASSTVRNKILQSVKDYQNSCILKPPKKGHLILILDKEFSQLPLESCELLKDQSVSRMPSLALLCQYLQQWKMKKVVNPDLVYFLVNPGSDLMQTEERMKEFVSARKNWKGNFGTVPPLECIKQSLQSNDIYLYCGHGCGGKYFPSHEVVKCELECSPILMGCSSIHLKSFPMIEAHGSPHTYMLAGSPCVIGMLYQVTDRDCDRVTIDLMNKLASDEEDLTTSTAVALSRKSAKLFLTGAALVAYGLPLAVRKEPS